MRTSTFGSAVPSTTTPYCADEPTRARVCAARRGRLLLGHLGRLQPLQHLVDDLADRHLAAADGDVEVVGLLEAHLADQLGEQRRRGELLARQAVRAEGLRERVAALLLEVLALLVGEPLADLVAGARGAHEREPVARRARARGSR